VESFSTACAPKCLAARQDGPPAGGVSKCHPPPADAPSARRRASAAARKRGSGLSPAEKMAFVYRINLARRNLSPDQKRDALKRMRDIATALRAEDVGKWTQAKVGAELGVARSTVEGWLIHIDKSVNRRNDTKQTTSKPDSFAKRHGIPPPKTALNRCARSGRSARAACATPGPQTRCDPPAASPGSSLPPRERSSRRTRPSST